MTSGRRRFALWVLLAAALLGSAELAAALALRVIAGQAPFLLWSPDPAQIAAAANRGEADSDPDIGWPSPAALTQPPRDATGAKFNADFPQPGQACASAYGDSFIWGDDVPPMEGWIEQLARRLGCRVANYGVPGHGTDQALIRSRRLAQNDEAPVAILGIFPENAMRNVNQYRPFLFGTAPDRGWLKGRFVLDDGKLAWIERPSLDGEAFTRLHARPDRALPREYLLPDTRDGPITLRFPYLVTAWRIATMPRLQSRMSGQPSWGEFYRPDHPSGALALTGALSEAFARETEARGKAHLVVILPSAGSFRGHARAGRFEYAPLVELLRERGVAVFDPAPAVLAKLGADRFCELYAAPRDCSGHFGVAGGGVIADIVWAELARRKLLKFRAAGGNDEEQR